MSQRQMEIAVVIGGGILLVIIVPFIFMVNAWGLAGTLWRLFSLAVLVGVSVLIWRHRRKIAAHMEKRRQKAAAQAAATKAAMAAAEARKPRPLRGNFPTNVTFLGQNDHLDLDRGSIKGPLVYAVAGGVGDTSEPSLIGSNLNVAPPASHCDEPLPYGPNYRSATPAQRSVYLNWLLTGRRQLPPEIGYVFIFFYGLERRALIDRQDIAVIFDEVLRLRQFNASSDSPNHSFESYATSFLWLLATVYSEQIRLRAIQLLAESVRSWDEDSLSAALSWFARTGHPLPGWMALIVAGQLPGSKRSVVVNRVEGHFRELFLKRHADRFGNGMTVALSKRHRVYTYKPASAAVRTAKISNGPNPLGIQSQFKTLADIWNDCIEDLRRLSSVVRRESRHEMAVTEPQSTAEMWDALPAEIRATTDHPMLDRICRLVQESSDEDGHTFINIGKLAETLCWETRERYSISDSVWISRTVEECGYCLEPDPRLTGKPYLGSDTVTVFLRTTDEETDMVRYRTAACMLCFGMVVASSDGSVHADELAVILQDIEQLFELNECERRRLEALRNLIMTKGLDMAGVARLAKLLKPEYRQAISKLLLVLAAKDGEVTREEVRAIRKCYKTLGFDQTEIGHALNSLRAYQNDEPVTIRPGAPAIAGEPIPAAKHKPVLLLNRAAIAQIMADTREVAQLLAEAMNAGEQPCQTPFSNPFIPPTPVPPPQIQTISPPGEQTQKATTDGQVGVMAVPPPRYASFYQLLISKQEWDVREVDGLARRQGLMLGGAIDALNEWAAEKYGGQLFVEDGGKILVERAYLD